MSTNLIRLTSLPQGLMARVEGYFMLDRLIEGFESGSNAFDSPGEALFGVQRAGTFVGIGGLNIDPYFEDPSIGRVRHLYIHPRARRSGVGRRITRAIENHARGHFCRLPLLTAERAAGVFYEALGFEVVVEVRKVSHARRLDAGPADLPNRSFDEPTSPR